MKHNDRMVRARWRRRLALVGIAAGSSAVGGCMGPYDGPELSIRYSATGEYADPALFRASFRQGAKRLETDGSRMTLASLSAGRVQADLKGIRLNPGRPAIVRIALVRENGDTIAAESVTFTPEDRTFYGVGVTVGVHRPQTFCAQVIVAKPLPPREGTEGDSLFVLRGSLPRNAVC